MKNYTEIKIATAVMMFSAMMNDIIEESSAEIESTVKGFLDSNPDATVEEVAREFAGLVRDKISEKFEL